MSKPKIRLVDRTHSEVPILSAVDRDSQDLRVSQSSSEDSRVAKVSHLVIYSMNSRECSAENSLGEGLRRRQKVKTS